MAKNEARDVSPISFSNPMSAPPEKKSKEEEEAELQDARLVNPFQIIQRGEDTLDSNEAVTFADFSPRVLPADAPEEPLEDPAPKGGSAPELAPSSASRRNAEPVTSDKTVQQPVGEGDGKPSPSESSKQASSSNQKNG